MSEIDAQADTPAQRSGARPAISNAADRPRERRHARCECLRWRERPAIVFALANKFTTPTQPWTWMTA